MVTHSLKSVQLPLTGVLNSFSNDSSNAKHTQKKNLMKTLCLNEFIQQLVLVLKFDEFPVVSNLQNSLSV